MINHIAAIISLSVILTSLIPFAIYLYTHSNLYLFFGLSTFISLALNGILKLILGTRLSIFKRPANAFNCSSWNTGGKCGGKPGFPSGHTQSTIFFVILFYLITKNKWILLVGLLWTIIVAWSRIHRHCHTLLQTIFGAIVGYILALVIYKLFIYYKLVE
jgi:membrane-associated phospholipid phosphatase